MWCYLRSKDTSDPVLNGFYVTLPRRFNVAAKQKYATFVIRLRARSFFHTWLTRKYRKCMYARPFTSENPYFKKRSSTILWSFAVLESVIILTATIRVFCRHHSWFWVPLCISWQNFSINIEYNFVSLIPLKLQRLPESLPSKTLLVLTSFYGFFCFSWHQLSFESSSLRARFRNYILRKKMAWIENY